MSSSKRAHSPTEALFVVNVLQESREQHFGDVPILSAHERWKTWRCGWRVSTTVTHSLSILDKLKCLYYIIFDREQNF